MSIRKRILQTRVDSNLARGRQIERFNALRTNHEAALARTILDQLTFVGGREELRRWV
jgi:hypothetical protein